MFALKKFTVYERRTVKKIEQHKVKHPLGTPRKDNQPQRTDKEGLLEEETLQVQHKRNHSGGE